MELETSSALPETGSNAPSEKVTHDLDNEPSSPPAHKKRRTDSGFGDSPDVKEETDVAPEDRIEEELAAALNPTSVETQAETDPQTQPSENSSGLESADAPDPEVAAVFGSIIDRAERLEEQYALDQLPSEGSEQSPIKSVTFVKASLSLKIQSLPILDNLSTQILSLLAKSSYQDITSFVSEPDSENGQAYATMRSLFDHTKRVYSTKQAFLSPTDLDLTEPTQVDIIRKANLASFVSSIFGSQEISFAELNDHFLDVFVPEGSRLLKVQGALFLELKTQAFIASLNNEERTRTEVLFELFPDDLEQTLLSKRSGTRQLAPSEADFVKRARSRRDIIFADINSEEQMKALPDKYHWEDFLRDLSAYISKNFEAINSQQSRKIIKGRPSISGESQEAPSGAPLESQFTVATQPAEVSADRNLHGDLVARAARAAQIALQGHGLRKSQQSQQQSQQSQPQPQQQQQTPQQAPQSTHSTPAPQAINQSTQQNINQAYQQSPTPPGYPQQLTFQHNTIPLQNFQQYTPPQNGSSSARANDAVANYGYMPGVPHYSQSQPTQVLYERARMAATAKSSSNSRRAGLPSQRRPWTTEEENALMAGLDRVKGPHWSQILAMFGPGGTINEALKDRNQVQLKDKARNLKLFFLKSGIEVPYYLKFVTGELKTRAPAQAAKNEAREREKKRGEEDKAHVEGIEGMMALAGAHMSPGQGPESMSASPAIHQGPEDQAMLDQTEEQKLIQSLAQETGPEELLHAAAQHNNEPLNTAEMHNSDSPLNRICQDAERNHLPFARFVVHRPQGTAPHATGWHDKAADTNQAYCDTTSSFVRQAMADSASPSTTQPPAAAAGSQLPPSSQPTQVKEVSSSSLDVTNNGPSALVPSADTADRDTELGDTNPIDDTVDNDINMSTEDIPAAANGTADASGTAGPENPVAALPSSSAPTKKESSLREFLGKMDEYAPIIPDAVTAHYLTVAGLPPPGNGPNQTPPHLARLLALATQKFVADIAADAYQYSRIRASNSSSASNPMGGLNAAAGLAGSGAAGGAAGAGSGADAGKKGGATNTHLGIQRPGFGGGGQGGSGQGRTVLTMEDLGMAVSEYGVSVKRGEFYR